MTKQKALGKGLGAIFKSENVKIKDNNLEILEIELEKIQRNPYQPRKIFNEEKIKELAQSIKKNGLLQPIILKKTISGYYIIAGERRFKAFEMLNKKTIPAIIKEYTDEEMMVLATIENLQREDLTALEEATSYKKLMETLNITQEELAKKIGKSRPYVANTIRLLKLPYEIKEYLMAGKISPGHAKALLSLKNEMHILTVTKKAIRENMSVRALEDYINKILNPVEKKIPKKDIYIESQEKKLKNLLGTTVKIKQNRNKKGKIEIEFKNNDEFERIVKLFKE
ncbi:ParB/RepB/Spo0J family partition protein [Gemelliphila asaccharolytica]|uniref:Stage 0 sporulation protein J n=1 Tax=Gemelliphila asaccharolytica TaxID=502393 RepID=A0ABR5TNA7_9BACL|nr:ParB/RepB/Spo0J family partition protein [Gemella asaccharolytica]KXB58889.1 putative stage 0 sporulation protein J [Gemella asaccharolytica]